MPMLAAHPGGDPEPRFRALEKQCADLRQEQRQLAGWLSQSQQQLEQESRARARAEQATETLFSQMGQLYNELRTAGEASARDLADTQASSQRGLNVQQEALSQLTGEVNAVAVDLQSLSSGQKTLQTTATELATEVNSLGRLSKNVEALNDRTSQLSRTLEDRLAEVDAGAKAGDEELGAKLEETMRQLNTLNGACSELVRGQQRVSEDLVAGLRRTEQQLGTQVADVIAGRGRELTQEVVGESEGRTRREVETALGAGMKEVAGTLRRETDEKLRALTTAVRDSAAERQANEDRAREDFKNLLRQHKDKLAQTAEQAQSGMTALEQALRTETDARAKLESMSLGQFTAFSSEHGQRQQQMQQELLAIEESLEAGLTQLRGELIGRLEGSMSAVEEGDRRRERELRGMRVNLGTQIEAVKERRPDGVFPPAAELASVAEAIRLHDQRHGDHMHDLAEQRAAIQQLRTTVTQREEREQKQRAQLEDLLMQVKQQQGAVPVNDGGSEGGLSGVPEPAGGGGGGGVGAGEGAPGEGASDSKVEEMTAALEQMGSEVVGEREARERGEAEWREELAQVDQSLDTLDSHLKMAAEERQQVRAGIVARNISVSFNGIFRTSGSEGTTLRLPRGAQIAELAGAAASTTKEAMGRIDLLERALGEKLPSAGPAPAPLVDSAPPVPPTDDGMAREEPSAKGGVDA
jgi:chromosome segregation ATPase